MASDVIVSLDVLDFTLSSAVNWQYGKKPAEDNVRKLSGVSCMTNKSAIKPRVDADDVKSKIRSRTQAPY
jgi:osmotically-inducible protein OsmY